MPKINNDALFKAQDEIQKLRDSFCEDVAAYNDGGVTQAAIIPSVNEAVGDAKGIILTLSKAMGRDVKEVNIR